MITHRLVLGLLLLTLPCAAWAGPPFVTDDPEPTDAGHWEIYQFATALGPEGEAGLDLNYGLAKDFQLTAVVPLAWEGSGGPTGLGAIELGAKYRFLHQADGSPLPDISIFPTVTLPTGIESDDHTTLFLPLWAQKDIGAWSVFGGGGYTWNPGERNFWTGGVAVQRQMNDALSLGVEAYHRDAESIGERGVNGANIGITYRLTPHWSVMASGGPAWEGHVSHGAGYLALKADF